MDSRGYPGAQTSSGILGPVLAVALGCVSCGSPQRLYDLVLEGGRVIDGTGAPPQVADVAILEGRVAYVGTRRNLDARRRLDVSGLMVAPGFIEVHGHLYSGREFRSHLDTAIRQGVTLVAVGADGDMTPERISGLRSQLVGGGAPINLAAYVGWDAVLARGNSKRGGANFRKLLADVAQGLEMGAIGVASCGMTQGNVTTLTREETRHLRLLVANAGASFVENVRNPIEDRFPYDGGATTDLRLLARLQGLVDRNDDDPPTGKASRTCGGAFDLSMGWLADYRGLQITSFPARPGLVGRELLDLSRANESDPRAFVVGLLAEADGLIGVAVRTATGRVLRDLPTGRWLDPRDAGLFARSVRRFVRELPLLQLHEAVQLMTSVPADKFGLVARGCIDAGCVADVIVLSAEFRDRATWTEPQLPAEGLVHALVNGILVVEDGRRTAATPGTFVPRNSATAASAVQGAEPQG